MDSGSRTSRFEIETAGRGSRAHGLRPAFFVRKNKRDSPKISFDTRTNTEYIIGVMTTTTTNEREQTTMTIVKESKNGKTTCNDLDGRSRTIRNTVSRLQDIGITHFELWFNDGTVGACRIELLGWRILSVAG